MNPTPKRPKLTCTIATRLAAEDFRKLQALAHAAGAGLSKYVREILKKWLVPLIILLAVAPIKVQAQWTVFDPTSYIMFTKIWTENVSMDVKLAQEITQGANLLNQTMQIYGLAQQEASFLSKPAVLGRGITAAHASIPGYPAWDLVLTSPTGIANAGMAWQQMANPTAALPNRILLTDSFAASTIKSIGDCNSASISNDALLGTLEGQAVDMSTGANTAASQRNLANMTASQQNRWHQCEENLAEQHAKLLLLQAQQMRDRDQRAIDQGKAITSYNAAGGGAWNVSPEEDLLLIGMH